MKNGQWQKVKVVFDNALQQKSEDRLNYVKEACGDDKDLFNEIGSLLASLGNADEFLETPAIEEVAEIIENETEKLETGKSFGHYEIIKQIGYGGMGEVYLAKDNKLDRQVAVKILNEKFSQHESNLQRFVQEAKAASSLNHPNILVIHEIGESNKTHFIVSEYIEGQTLREILKEKSLELKEIIDISIQTSNALSAAHQAHIVHRDIKPENIMIRPDGYVKILDFGLAKLIENNALIRLDEETVKQNQTAKGIILGTVNYMSPEQAKGEKVDERSDIFSLGEVIYEMIAGKTPFQGDSISETFANLIKVEPQPLSRFTANVPNELERIVFKMLKKNKNERYQTMQDLLVDLKSLKENLLFDEKLERSNAPEDENATKVLQAVTGNLNQNTGQIQQTFVGRLKQHKTLAAVALIALMIGAGSLGYYFMIAKRGAAISANNKKSLAVLPFINASQDANAEYLTDGITENVINNLSQLANLKVMSKNSAFRFKGAEKQTDLQKIASDLGVQTLLTGKITPLNDKLVVDVELIDASDNSHIWGKQFVKSSTDLIQTQNEIAQSVAQNLRINLSDEEKQILNKRPTTNEEAYQLFLKGRFWGQQINPDSLNKAIDFYNQAIEKDSNFALAYSDMAIKYLLLGMYFSPPNEAMPKAKMYANKAIQLDKTIPDPHLILGQVALLYDWDWDKAKEELAEGNAVTPQSIESFSCSAHILQSTGRTSESDESLTNALKNDPLSISLNTELGCSSYYSRRYDQSIIKYREALSLEPRNFVAIYGLGRSLNQLKQYQEAISEIEKAKTFMPMLPPIAIAEEGYANAKLGKRDEAEKQLKMLEEMSKQHFIDPFFMAMVYLSLNDKDKSFAALEKAYETKSSLMPTLINDIKWDEWRNDDRFKSLLKRMNIV